VYPQGHSVQFISDVLLAWRCGAVVCPLEPGQAPPAVPPPPPWCAHLKTTSATTGAPRVVAFTAAQLAADPDHIVATMGLRSDWPNLGVISLAHSYGFSNLVLPLLLHGIPLVLAPSPLPEAVRRAAHGHPALALPAVPALWRAWHEADAIPANVKLAISAGAPLPLPLEEAVFARSGLKIHNFYGASECGGIAYDRSATPRADATLAGTPLDHVTLALAGSGCLEVRGANVAQGYWPEATPELGDGVFRTSDLAAIRDGQVFLLGRASDVINVAGRKVAPETIERALLAHSQVREALALGLPETNGSREEIIAAVVAAERPFPEAELRRFLSERLPPWQTPRVWHFVERLERNDRGKVSRAEWRRRLLHGP
jgi:acyl-CoA synthetase (AMP-forming)/AMP-acid ligase II